MKFINDYDPGFLGATGWDYNDQAIPAHKPFYTHTNKGIIILDSEGISYYEYDTTIMGMGWTNDTPIDTYTDALNIVCTLEALNINEFAEYIKLTYRRTY